MELRYPINHSFLRLPQTGSNPGSGATLLNLFPRRNYAIACHEFKKDTTNLEAPLTKKKKKTILSSSWLSETRAVAHMNSILKKVPKGHIL